MTGSGRAGRGQARGQFAQQAACTLDVGLSCQQQDEPWPGTPASATLCKLSGTAPCVPATCPAASAPAHLQAVLEVVRQQAAVRKHNVVHHQHRGVLGQLPRHGAAGLVQVPPCLWRAGQGRVEEGGLRSTSQRTMLKREGCTMSQQAAAQAPLSTTVHALHPFVQLCAPAGCGADRRQQCRPR